MLSAVVKIPVSIATSVSLLPLGVNDLKLALAMFSVRNGSSVAATLSAAVYMTGVKAANVCKSADRLNAGILCRDADGDFNGIDSFAVVGNYGSRRVVAEYSVGWMSHSTGETVAPLGSNRHLKTIG
jgi:hypothetical protein